VDGQLPSLSKTTVGDGDISKTAHNIDNEQNNCEHSASQEDRETMK
jgi:hypothetical protein